MPPTLPPASPPEGAWLGALAAAFAALALFALSAVVMLAQKLHTLSKQRPSVVLAMPEVVPGGATVVVNSEDLSAVELTYVDVVGTTTARKSPAAPRDGQGAGTAQDQAKQEKPSRRLLQPADAERPSDGDVADAASV